MPHGQPWARCAVNCGCGDQRFVRPTIGALVGAAMITLAVFPIFIGIRELKDWRGHRAASAQLPKER
ncbi:hypothetical protein [Nocardia sp. NBC_00403]|uniref:hypothetical protein n=1 Tax=Nocardia sp. NBC_00403 TaxID=2975990 RepID=UPI002E1F5DD0